MKRGNFEWVVKCGIMGIILFNLNNLYCYEIKLLKDRIICYLLKCVFYIIIFII